MLPQRHHRGSRIGWRAASHSPKPDRRTPGVLLVAADPEHLPSAPERSREPCLSARYDCIMFRFLIPLAAGALIVPGFASDAQELKTAASHPIQYYVSLPKGWNGERTWPVVMIIEAAEREF